MVARLKATRKEKALRDLVPHLLQIRSTNEVKRLSQVTHSFLKEKGRSLQIMKYSYINVLS